MTTMEIGPSLRVWSVKMPSYFSAEARITSSGLKNEFPRRLLDTFDRLNRWLYAPASPLNWFTKRRPMRIRPRRPQGASHGERLWNQSGIGLVTLDAQGRPVNIAQLGVDGSITHFLPDD